MAALKAVQELSDAVGLDLGELESKVGRPDVIFESDPYLLFSAKKLGDVTRQDMLEYPIPTNLDRYQSAGNLDRDYRRDGRNDSYLGYKSIAYRRAERIRAIEGGYPWTYPQGDQIEKYLLYDVSAFLPHDPERVRIVIALGVVEDRVVWIFPMWLVLSEIDPDFRAQLESDT